MFKQIVISATLIAMSNLMLGSCATYTRMNLGDLLDSKHTRISEATTRDGNRIVFDSVGAAYLDRREAIHGITTNGSQAYWLMRNLDEITLVDPAHPDTLPLVVSAEEYPSHLSLKKFDGVSSVVTSQGEKYRFSPPGASLHYSDRTIVGSVQPLQNATKYGITQPSDPGSQSLRTADGGAITQLAVAVPFDSIAYVELYRSHTRGVLYAVLGGLAGFIALGAIAISAGGLY